MVEAGAVFLSLRSVDGGLVVSVGVEPGGSICDLAVDCYSWAAGDLRPALVWAAACTPTGCPPAPAGWELVVCDECGEARHAYGTQ